MAEDIKDVSTRGALIAIAIATIVIAVILSLTALGPEIGTRLPKKDSYQAVFLTNGQVYFGKLSGVSGKYVRLREVFYIQSNPQQSSPSPQPQLSLVELGNEIHGPESEMQIANDQVIFWENLKDDSRVVEAIKNRGNNQNQQNNNQQQPQNNNQQQPQNNQ